MTFTYKQIGAVAAPILVSLLMDELIQITDTIFLGHVGETELAASALAGVYYIGLFMLAFGFGLGIQIVTGRYNGEKKYRLTGNVFFQGLWFLLALAGVLFAASDLLSPLILRSVIGSDAVFKAALSYMEWRIWGFFFSFAAVAFRAFYVGTLRPRVLTVNSLIMLAVNVVLNYILIFGKLGLPAMGIAGAALGSSLAELVSLLFFAGYMRTRTDRKKYGLDRFRFDGKTLKHVLDISFWTMMQAFLSVAPWFLFFAAVEHLGERSLAVANIVRSIGAFFFIVVHAFATAASSLASNLIGAGHPEGVMRLCRRTIGMAYAAGMPFILLMALFPDLVLGAYTDLPDLVAAARPTFYVMLAIYPVSAPAFILFNTVSGTGHSRTAFWIELVIMAVYSAYVFYVAVELKAPVAVCWTAEGLYVALMLTLSYLYLRRGKWQEENRGTFRPESR